MAKYQEDLHPRFRKEFVLESAIVIVKNNTLTFDSEFYLQIKRRAIFAPTYISLTIGHHAIKLYSIISQSYASASKHFQNSWFRYLDDCQILLKVNFIKPEYLLSILNQVNNNIQSTTEKRQTRIPFLDVMINKNSTKIWMDIYNKPTDSKRYVPCTSNNPQHCLTNIPFPLASRICTIVENENVKEKRFKELKIILLKQKYTKSPIEASILRHKEIPFEVLRQPKTPKNEKILRLTFIYNPNNPDIFSSIKQSFDNFQYSKTVSNIFQRKKSVKSMSQAPNLVR